MKMVNYEKETETSILHMVKYENRCYNKRDIAHYKYYGARNIGARELGINYW